MPWVGLGWVVVVAVAIVAVAIVDISFVSLAFAWCVVGFVTCAVASAGAVASAWTVAVGWIVIVAVAVANCWNVFWAGVWAIAVAIAWAGTGAVAGAVAWTVVGVGLAGVGFGSLSVEQDWKKPLALLTLQWFCWFPSVSFFGTLGLKDLLSLTWLQIALVELLLVVICVVLWQRGQQLEDMARNPFQGGILEAELRARCSR